MQHLGKAHALAQAMLPCLCECCAVILFFGVPYTTMQH